MDTPSDDNDRAEALARRAKESSYGPELAKQHRLLAEIEAAIKRLPRDFGKAHE